MKKTGSSYRISLWLPGMLEDQNVFDRNRGFFWGKITGPFRGEFRLLGFFEGRFHRGRKTPRAWNLRLRRKGRAVSLSDMPMPLAVMFLDKSFSER